MMKGLKDTAVGPWAKEKLEALAEYLNFYTTALKNQSHWLRGTIFFDAFAGPGTSSVRSKKSLSATPTLFEADAAAVEFLKGSPRVALEIANPFSSYIFVERDRRRAVELSALKREYGGRYSIVIKEEDANTALKEWLGAASIGARIERLCFLIRLVCRCPGPRLSRSLRQKQSKSSSTSHSAWQSIDC
jgi:three-Cys-motif partner protein